MGWIFKYWWRRLLKRNYIVVYSNDIATYVNAYEIGRIIDSEVFWKEDYEEDKSDMLCNIDKSVKYFKTTYNIKKIYNEQHYKKDKK